MLKKFLLVSIVIFYSCFGFAKEVNYSINITSYSNKINGKNVSHFLLNNTSPGPVIKANIGDDISITFNNKTNIDTIIHWHGVMVPNSQDGVADVTQPAIKAGESFTYKFKVKQTGTYWYHAHGLEEAQGVYGGIVFGNNSENLDNENVVIYSGELLKNPDEVLVNLNKSSSNMNQQSNNLSHMDSHNHMSSMMHFSDVNYNANLINGKANLFYIKSIKNNKIKLRIINAYVDGFINLVYSGGDIKVVSADGLPIKPIKVNHLRIAMGETYDIVLDVKNKKSYELVSFFMGEDSYSKVIIGKGNLVALKSLHAEDYDQDQVYNRLKTLTPPYLNFDKFKTIESHKFVLNGNHDKYVWSINENGKALKNLNVKVGDKIKVKITNYTMMPHPMHLHGTFFKVKLKNSSNNLIKHTINLDPMESIEIEFIVDEQGKWLFHCHNLFHMASGMMIVINASK